MKCCFTIDVDMTDYIDDVTIDEMEFAFPVLKKILVDYPELKTTWFIRIDSQIESIYGCADFVFSKYAANLEWLEEHGHEIAWHHHAYRRTGRVWKQEKDEDNLCGQLCHYGETARKLNLTTTRMGWAYQTDATLNQLIASEFKADSSAIPRPVYPWSGSSTDWSITPKEPYQPSVLDYRVPGSPQRDFWEVPMTTTVIPVDTDTMPNVERCLNPSYFSHVFRQGLSGVRKDACVVTILHPYEILPKKVDCLLLAFDERETRTNIEAMYETTEEFVTIAQLVAGLRQAKAGADFTTEMGEYNG